MRRTLIGFIAIAALSCGPRPANTAADTSRPAAAMNDPVTVQRSIDSAHVVFREAMTKGDTVAMASIYAEDAMVLPGGAKMVRGRKDVMHMDAGMMSSMSIPSFKTTTTDLIVTGDYAIEIGAYEMTMNPRKGKQMTDVGKYVSVWKKQPDGSWKMIRDSFSSDKRGM